MMAGNRDKLVWDEQRLRDPHGAADKARRVRRMFGAIVDSYDLNNRVHSLGMDQRWRRRAAGLAAVRPGDVVLDVACGTGDLLLAFAGLGVGRLIGVDFCPAMLVAAKRKIERHRTDVPASLAAGDAMALPLPDASVDVVSIAFGIRNVAQPDRALAEFARVLRPGGRLVILEFAMPTNRAARRLYQFYFTQIMPRLATAISRDRTGAYRYLPRSVLSFMDSPALLQALERAQFEPTRASPLTFGVAVVYLAVKPALRPG